MRLPQRLLAFFLSFVLIFSSTSALATTSVGGWTALDTVTAGATNTINAAKTAGGKALKSAVAVAPSAVKVGKHLIKGGGQAALAYAVVELLGEGIDWVLDPENNRIKYGDVPQAPTGGQANPKSYFNNPINSALPAVTAYDACRIFGDAQKQKLWASYTFKYSNSTCFYVIDLKDGRKGIETSTRIFPSNKEWDGGAGSGDDYKYLPINTVAEKVISNAEAGHAPSQEAVKATALEGFAAGEHDAALDAAATEAGTENPPDTENPPKDPDAPAEPFDPAGIISAINALKALLAGILSSITSLSDWFKADPEQKDNEVDIPDVPLPEPNTDISFGGSCPADLSVNFNLYGTSTDFVLMPFSKFCPLLSTFVKPTLIVLGSFFAVSIVGGRRDE